MMNRKIMKRDSVRKAARAVVAAVLVESIAAQGCSLIVGGLEVPDETTPTGGSAGTGGIAGSGGSGGMGAFGGSAGHAGNGGAGAQAGNGGEAGYAGEGGEAGFGGTGGEAGFGGTGGSGGVGGNGGTAGAGGSGTVCPGVFNASVTTSVFSLNVAKPVGGYDIIYTGQSASGVNMDVECAANHAVIAQGIYCNGGGPESQVNVTVDGKKIRLYNINSNPSAASMNVNVETL
jgi:hypothetical protein